ncbi:hypothetical protein Tco_0766864, partial [Tanacetum coccineum]
GMFNKENVDYPELIWEDLAYQIDYTGKKRDQDEYGHPIPDVMLIDAIKRSESYQMFIKYSINQISPKKRRGKGLKGRKNLLRRKSASRRVVKKKITLSADDNIISDDPDAALELAKSISQTEAEEAEAARKVHATHVRIVTESIPESGKKKSGGRSLAKLKGTPSLTPAEQEAANIMQALKESKKTSRRQPGIGGSHEGTGSKPGVLDESTVISATTSEGTDEQDSEHSNDDNDDAEKDEKDGDADDEGDDHASDKQDDDDEDDKTESDEDDIYTYKIRVRKDKDEEMKDAEVKGSDKGDEEITDAAKEEGKKTSEAKDDTKKTELPSSSSSLSISSVIPIILTVQQTTTLTITTDAPTITTIVLESNALIAVKLRVVKLEKDVSELKTGDHSSIALAVLQSYISTVVDSYLDTKHLPELTKKPTPTTEQESKKSPLKILKIKKEQAESQKNLQFTIKSTDKAALEEYDLKTLIEDENVMDKGVADTVKDHKRKYDDDEDPPAGPNQGKKTKRKRTKESESSKKPSTTKETSKGKTPTKGSKTGKSAPAKEPVEEPITEVIMDDAGDDVARDDDQPQDTSEPNGLLWGLEVSVDTGISMCWIGVLGFLGVGNTHRYVVSSIMDTAYWLSEQYSSKYLCLSSRMCFGDQFLKLFSDSSLVSTVKDYADADKIPVSVIPETTNLPPIPEIVSKTPVTTTDPSPQVTPIISTVQQITTLIPTPTITTDALTVTIVVPESNALTVVILRVVKLEKDVSELKTCDHSSVALVVSSLLFKSCWIFILIPNIFRMLTKKSTPTAEQESKKSPSEILKIKKEQAESQRPTNLPSKSESSKKPSSTKETPKGKAPTKGSKTGKSASAKEPVEEPIAEVIMDDAGDDLVRDDDQPQAASKPKTSKTLNPEWFKQPPRPLTPDPEWNKRQVNKFSKQNVYSTKAIIGVKSVSVKKLHGYGHLEEIVVKRSDQQLYKFKEGDFVDLHLNDIEDMLLLAVQYKLFHLDGNFIVDFIVALCMFTRSLILKRHVEDLQLGIERIVYEDLNKQKRVLRADELYKFSDGTLKSVRDEIHHRVLDFRLDYNAEMPKRKWTAVD